ncbi:uncharacterized protein LOC124805543 [Schistocerca piceifrons]|uniref:uncharacterized protein LOC124805543 n=1 Tax=Schistocerca piceifrons TaxID=274613 RepID=UPI001F5F12B8|nr:uncharacterized protein LOC124805543 [Schistocerca piceifrons]
MSGRGRGRKAAALAELLLTLAGTSGKKKRKTAAQCFRCQKLDHFAKHCSGTVACLKCAQAHDTRDCKKQDTPCTCVNCGGAHAANARSCAYRRNWRGPEKKKTQKQVTTTHEEVVSCTKDVVHRRLNDGVQEAMSAFKSAMAEERAAMLAELGERLGVRLLCRRRNFAQPKKTPPQEKTPPPRRLLHERRNSQRRPCRPTSLPKGRRHSTRTRTPKQLHKEKKSGKKSHSSRFQTRTVQRRRRRRRKCHRKKTEPEGEKTATTANRRSSESGAGDRPPTAAEQALQVQEMRAMLAAAAEEAIAAFKAATEEPSGPPSPQR